MDKMGKLEYGKVLEFADGTELWFQPVTDETDGFVLQNEDGSIGRFFKEMLEKK